MKITDITFRPIAIPYHTPWRNRHTEERGVPMTHLKTSIVEVGTDEGITGLGEVRGASVDESVQNEMKQFLNGQDPTQISTLVPALEQRFAQS